MELIEDMETNAYVCSECGHADLGDKIVFSEDSIAKFVNDIKVMVTEIANFEVAFDINKRINKRIGRTTARRWEDKCKETFIKVGVL
jgi:hypothetical protein